MMAHTSIDRAQPLPGTHYYSLAAPLLMALACCLARLPAEAQTTVDDVKLPSQRQPGADVGPTNAMVLPLRDAATDPTVNPWIRLYTNRFGQVLPDYAYVSTNHVEPPPKVVIEPEPDGAVARGNRHAVRFKPNLKHEDAITISMPDGQVLQGRPVALAISDGAGHRVWLGELQESRGELAAEDTDLMIWRDAFQGIRADVIVTCGPNEVEQLIVLREWPALAKELDENSARLEVWSEFIQAPEPRQSGRQVQFRKGRGGGGDQGPIAEQDQSLDFGSMRMAPGKAFRLGAGDNLDALRDTGTAVVKRWWRDGQRAYLLESADYLSLRSALDALEVRQARADRVTSVTNLAFLRAKNPGRASARARSSAGDDRGQDVRGTHSLPPCPIIVGTASLKQPFAGNSLVSAGNSVRVQTGSRSVLGGPGVVLDYRLVTTSLLNINFGTGNRVGPAAVGRDSGDYWNAPSTCGLSPATVNDLAWSDGTASGVQLVLDNAPGCWGNNTGDIMMDGYVYPWNGGNAVVTLNYIPAGYYDFYIYGAWGGVGQVNGNYVLSVGGQSLGNKRTILSSSWASLNWTEGEHYALYANVAVAAGQAVTVTAMPGGNVALFNGLQMVAAGSVNTPPTISAIPNQTTVKNVAIGPIGFTVNDAETPASSLTVTAASANQTLVPNTNLVLGGSGSNRTITMTPAANLTSSATITVTVSDGSAQSSTSFVLTVGDTQVYAEIPKSSMVADCSTTGWGWVPQYAINGSLTDPGWHNAEGRTPGTDWLRLDLQASKQVARVQYYPRQGAINGTFLQYEIYVTSNSSTNISDWGTPAASGSWTWPNGAELKTVDFSTVSGRYVVFRCLKGAVYDRYASADEVWAYSLATNTPPTISSVSDQSVRRDTVVGPLSFTVNDAETPAASLVVTASSSNQGLAPNANLVLGGSGSARTIAVTPAAGQTGTATITLTVSDGALTAQTTFVLSVLPPVQTPSLSATFNGDHSTAVVTGTTQPGATVYYTTDNSDPTPSSSAIAPTVTTTTTVKARAYQTGYAPSDVAVLSVVATGPVSLSPNGHSPIQYSLGPLSVTLASDAGSTIYYQAGASGEWLSTSSGSTVSIDGIDNGVGTIQAYSFTSTTLKGPTTTSASPYYFRLPHPSSAISFDANHTAGTLTLSDAQADVTIRYTTDGSVPTWSSAIYTTPLTYSAATKVYAKAFKDGYIPSGQISAWVNALPAPSIATAAGVVTADQIVNNAIDVWLVPNLGIDNAYGEARDASGWDGGATFLADGPNASYGGSFQGPPWSSLTSANSIGTSCGRTYTQGGWVKNLSGQSHDYAGVLNLDQNNASILAQDIGSGCPYAVTYLASDLVDGATLAYLHDATSFSPVQPDWSANLFVPLTSFSPLNELQPANQPDTLHDIFQTYLGTLYVIGVNLAANSVQLSSAYSGPTLPAGTAIAHRAFGGTYQYALYANLTTPPAWTQYTATYDWLRPGTEKVRLLQLPSRDGGVSAVTGMEFWEGQQADRPNLFYTLDGNASVFSQAPVAGPVKITLDGNQQATVHLGQRGTYYLDSPVTTRTFTFQVAAPAVSFSVTTSPRSFLSSDGFSADTQGANHWSYRYFDLMGDPPGAPLPGYNADHVGWGLVPDDLYCLVGQGWQHPGAQHDSVRVFVAPFTGHVSISGAAYIPTCNCSDGAQARILRNADVVVPWT